MDKEPDDLKRALLALLSGVAICVIVGFTTVVILVAAPHVAELMDSLIAQAGKRK